MKAMRRGKSGLRMAAQGITSLHRKVRTSGTERRPRAMIQISGTGEFWGAAGVKTAKLCAEQDQIGKRLSTASTKFPGRLLEGESNFLPRGMTVNKAR